MSFTFVTDNTDLRYTKPWSDDFPYCENCGIITSCKGGICTGCLTGVPWDIKRTTWLTSVITENWEVEDNS